MRYFVDGEREPCWSERVDESSSYCVASDARTAALKPGCEKVEGWFVDAACTVPFADGTVVQGATLDLFGRNIAEVRYALTDMARELFSERRCFADKQLEARWTANPCCRLRKRWPTGGAVVFATSQRMVRG